MKLAIPEQFTDTLIPNVLAIVPDATFVTYNDDGELKGDGIGVDVLFRWFIKPPALARLVKQLPDLHWLHIPRAGVDNTLIPEVMERDLLITNSVGVHAAPISEFVLLYILSHAKCVASLLDLQAKKSWGSKHLPINEIDGKTVLVIGTGKIGQAIITRCAAFGMNVIGSSRSGRPIAGANKVVGNGEWRSVLPEADYVVIAAPLTKETRHMFGAAEFALMKEDSYFINIARGEIADEDALLEALKNGPMAGAALDVFSTEPLPSDNPFWTQPNVFVTPHASWHSPDVQRRIFQLFYDNLKLYASHQPLFNIVDKEAGY